MNLRQLRRVRWAVRAVLVVAVAASVAANVLHAQPSPIAQVIAAWPPLALLATIELIARVPLERRWRTAIRRAATVVIAGIAAWVSYGHMAGVALRYGESPSSAHLLPLSVDGLVVVASVCLVELAGRITAGLTRTGPVEPVVLPERAGPPADAPSLLPVAPSSGSSEDEPADLQVISVESLNLTAEPDLTDVISAAEPVTPQLSDTESDTPADASAPVSPVAQRVLKAHVKFPDLDNRALARKARVSLSSVTRHRPAKPSVNGHRPGAEVPS